MRKIIHIDMDCYYAAIEMRDNPQLQRVPLAVGGKADSRGVIATANYLAREYGVRSAMPSSKAKLLCPSLIIVPPRMSVYREVSQQIRDIFQTYTSIIEPLSLDEAYLDVTEHPKINSASLIARKIKAEILSATGLTASAGVSYCKSLAKIASDWKKPNGLFVITPGEAKEFLADLQVGKLHGVGKVMQVKFAQLGIETCGQLAEMDAQLLLKYFGTHGLNLKQQAHGIDERPVTVSRIRKSISVENTFQNDINVQAEIFKQADKLLEQLKQRMNTSNVSVTKMHKLFVKLKFSDFTQTTVEQLSSELSKDIVYGLIEKGLERQSQAIRLLGIGIRIKSKADAEQQMIINFTSE